MKVTDQFSRLTIKQRIDLVPILDILRRRLESAFSPETAAPGFDGRTPSTGHCAAVSAILAEMLGADMVSAQVANHSHWFNRMQIGEQAYDFDLTGDQFGLNTVQCAEANKLYRDSMVRSPQDLNTETLERARLLAMRAGLEEIARRL